MKEYVTWEQVGDYIKNVADIINGSEENYKGIFTFPRGGLVLGVMLSYKTGLPLVTAPCKDCIIIDDICDTGITMKKYSDLKHDKNYFLTSMYIKDDQLTKNGIYKCDINYAYKVKTNNWIVFPWEDINE